MKSFVVILISLHLAFAKEAFEITQGLEEDPGDGSRVLNKIRFFQMRPNPKDHLTLQWKDCRGV